MKPIKQTKLSSEDGTISGNCFRSCLASMMEIDIDSIPAFEDMEPGEWFTPFYNFLNENGYEFEGTKYNYGKHVDKFNNYLMTYEGVDGYILVGGKSPRTYVTRGHAVLYKNGELVHDPHPSNDGLLEIEDFYMIKRKTNE